MMYHTCPVKLSGLFSISREAQSISHALPSHPEMSQLSSWDGGNLKAPSIMTIGQHTIHGHFHPTFAPVISTLQNFVSAKRSSADSSHKNSVGTDMGPRTVEITRGLNDALGISIAGGNGSPLGDIPIFIAMIQASGVAARTQKLK
ncbi:UNVERIFIED_CONTAM: hypothetical protein K2H54_051090, partial [Gekko kuhli]